MLAREPPGFSHGEQSVWGNEEAGERIRPLVRQLAQSEEEFFIVGYSNQMREILDPEKIRAGEIVTAEEPLSIRLSMIERQGFLFMPVFTSREKAMENGNGNVILNQSFSDICEGVQNLSDCEGLVIDPFSDDLIIFLGWMEKKSE